MFSTEVLQITQQALWLVVLLAGPPVVVTSLVGLLIALLQAATQLQEQTFQYMVKFFAVIFTILITTSMLGSALYHFSDQLFSRFSFIIQN